jgi:iron(III) transport system substrate-binding protein
MSKYKVYLRLGILVSIIVVLLIFAYRIRGRELTKGEIPKETIVIYTSESDKLLDATIPLFEEKYGIAVELVKGEIGELVSRLRAEGVESEADIIMGGSYSYMYSNRDLFQEYVSVNDKYILENYRNSSGLFTSYLLEGSCFIVNKSLAGDIKLDGYSDLLNERLKGKIITANPINSSYAFSHLCNTLLAMGGYESDEAWDYVTGLMAQVGEIASSSKKVYNSVAAGIFTVGLTYESPCIDLIRDNADVRIVYPKEGTVYQPLNMAIVKWSNNSEYAKHFIDFVTGKDMQNIYSSLLMKRSIYKDVLLGQYLIPISNISVLEEDMDYVKENKMHILSRYSVIIDELMGDN